MPLNPSDEPLVLCVVPTLGERPQWLRATLRSILGQQGVRLKVRCVTPAGRETVAQVAEEAGVEYVSDDRPGLSVAINHGFQHEIDVLPRFCMWLGDDDLLAPRALETAVRALERMPDAPYVYGHVRYISAENQTLGYARPTPMAWRYVKYGKNFIPQPGSLMRYQAVSEAGWLDESLKNAMDQDLLTKMSLNGKPAYVARELAAYRLHPGAITSNKGVRDESQVVRDRYRGRPSGVLGSVDRQLNVGLSRGFDILSRHFMPWPAIPEIDGQPYISDRTSLLSEGRPR